MIKNIEVKTLSYKGVNVTIKVDYDKGEGSIIDMRQGGAKQWVFNSRGLEYMNGWLDINMAIRNAMVEIKKELEWNLAEKSAFKKENELSVEIELLKGGKRVSKLKSPVK